MFEGFEKFERCKENGVGVKSWSSRKDGWIPLSNSDSNSN